MKKYFRSGSFSMGRSGKEMQNCFVFFVFLLFFFFFFFFSFFAPVPQILKMCGFIVFKIHVKMVNRKSLMLHVFTSVYGFFFLFLSVTEFSNSLNWILKSNRAQIDRAQNPIFQSEEYTNSNTHHLQNVLIQLFFFLFLSVTEFSNSLNWILKSNRAQIDRAQNPIFQSEEYTNSNTHHLQNVLIQLFDSPTPCWAKQKCKESVTLSQRICDRFHKEFTHTMT